MMMRQMIFGPGCWEWPGEKTKPGGYGRMRVNGRKESVHRLAYELLVEPIPDGLYVLHHCDNPPCWRPDHLFIGTALANKQDEVSKGRNWNASKTHCPAGHPYDETNTYHHTDGARRCKECRRASVRRYRARKSACEALRISQET